MSYFIPESQMIFLFKKLVVTLIQTIFCTVQVCRRHPDMVRAYVVCNCPHSNSMMDEMRAGWEQRLRSWYMLFFQGPDSIGIFCLDLIFSLKTT